jgi:hypothetical protein
MRKLALLIISAAVLALSGCYGNSNSSGGQTPAGGGTPTKEAAVQLLRSMNSAIEAKDYTKAASYVALPANASDFERMVQNQEISASGIDIMASRGKWGKLAEVFTPERAKGWADRAKVSVDSCYGLNYESGEAGFYWDGKEFKLIRCDDIGKLR